MSTAGSWQKLHFCLVLLTSNLFAVRWLFFPISQKIKTNGNALFIWWCVMTLTELLENNASTISKLEPLEPHIRERNWAERQGICVAGPRAAYWSPDDSTRSPDSFKYLMFHLVRFCLVLIQYSLAIFLSLFLEMGYLLWAVVHWKYVTCLIL